MNVLVLGYGSAGKRHLRLLAPLVSQLAVVSSQKVIEFPVYATIEEAFVAFSPTHIVVSTITSAHADALNTLKHLGFAGKVLVEKPLFSYSDEYRPDYPFTVHVAYQLRFHPLIAALKKELEKHEPLSAHVYVGQHLVQWRPDRNAKDTYSAHKSQGGGVTRDLSHELDLIQYLFGPIEEAYAMAARTSDLTVDSEDVVAFVLRAECCPVVSLQMNYLDHVARREWLITTTDVSLKADLIAKKLFINQEMRSIEVEGDEAYRVMHAAWLFGQDDMLCSLKQGLTLMTWIESVAT